MGDVALLRRVNESAVLDLLRAEGPLTRAELARRLQISPPTITRIVSDMLEQGIVLEHSHADSTGGRRPTLLEFNARAGLIIGIYVGGQTLTAALADLDGAILEREALPTQPGDAGVAQIVDLLQMLNSRAVALGIPMRGACVGAPSIVTHPAGEVLLAPSLGWRNLPLKQILEERTGLPVFVENEVNLIALGERWRGAGQGVDNLVCLSLGAGIGAGVILDGRLYRGTRHAAGEVGYVIPGERFLGRIYDVYGPLEGEAGYEGIVRRARERLARGEPSRLSTMHRTGSTGSTGSGAHGSQNGHYPADDGLTVVDVLQAAREGDRVGLAVMAETVDYLTIAAANLACIVDPQRIVLGGELVEYGDLLLEPMRRRLQGLVPSLPEVVLSALKIDAPILGAVVTALHETSGSVVVQPARP